jgi:hypothetical protein
VDKLLSTSPRIGNRSVMTLRDLDKLSSPNAPRPPIILASERQWALEQLPAWLPEEYGRQDNYDLQCHEIVDDGAWLDCPPPPPPPKRSWTDVIDYQIERFEKHYMGTEKTYFEWAQLWRIRWWSQVNLRKIYPDLAPSPPAQPYFRAGSPEFARALEIGTSDEVKIWRRFGIVQFRPDEPRLAYCRHGSRDELRLQLLRHADDSRLDGVVCLTSALFIHDLVPSCESNVWMRTDILPDNIVYGVNLHQTMASILKSGQLNIASTRAPHALSAFLLLCEPSSIVSAGTRCSV